MAGRIIGVSDGVVTKMHDLGDKVVIEKVEDVGSIIEANKRQKNSVDTSARMGELHHVGRIPAVVMDRWMIEDNINYLAKENRGLLLKKLEQRDNSMFKTDPRKFA